MKGGDEGQPGNAKVMEDVGEWNGERGGCRESGDESV